MITQERLKELLHYDHENGLFTWRPGRRGVPPWSIAGNMKSDGYMKVQVDNKYYLSHRLVWLYVFGYWPKEHIDHINGNKADNRLSNLREASPCQNEYNKGVRKDSMTGVKGVHWHIRTKKFRVRIKVDGKEKTLGFFRTIKEASAAYRKAELELRGEFAHGARLDRAE